MTDLATPNLTPYLSCAEITADRSAWAKACLIHLVNEGRREGWLEGSPFESAARPGAIRAVIDARIACTPSVVRVAPMQWLATRLGLGHAALDLLWLLACIECEPGLARLAQAFGSAACPDLSAQIAQRLVPVDGRQLEALDRLRLVELTADARTPQHRRAIRINDRVLDLVRGDVRLDAELEAIAQLHGADVGASDALSLAFASSPAPLIVATGCEGAGRATRLARAAGAHGFGTLRVKTCALAKDPVSRDRQLRAIVREACLFEVVPLFMDLDHGRDDAPASSIEGAMRSFGGPVLASAAEAVTWGDRPVVTSVMDLPETVTRAVVWSSNLPGARPEVVSEAAAKYRLRPGSIVAAARNAIASAAGDPTQVTIDHIHAGVRARLGDELTGLATRIEWQQTWDDLVLPVDQFDQIAELIARVRQRSTVLEQWGFGEKVGKGNGIAALFSGPPGTGKTMVAGLIARELGVDLYQVDLSKVVSKYIGETEKSLGRLFDAAETGHAIVLFDEADALFAKRSEVKSSNDRYANLEINYLLQRLESFTGLALLTTNHETAIDAAFRRRLAMHVRFPMPEEQQRAELWRAMLPATAPTSGEIDATRLGREFQFSGGYVKNAVLRAAYLAAEQGAPISMEHLWSSACAEYEAMGKVAYQRAA